VTAKALVEVRDVLHVWIEFRAPKFMDMAWTVPADATLEEALDHLLAGRDDLTEGKLGFGFLALDDMPEFAEVEYRDSNGTHIEPTRNIVVHVKHVRTLEHPIKLL
jgi:hypothetical protein